MCKGAARGCHFVCLVSSDAATTNAALLLKLALLQEKGEQDALRGQGQFMWGCCGYVRCLQVLQQSRQLLISLRTEQKQQVLQKKEVCAKGQRAAVTLYVWPAATNAALLLQLALLQTEQFSKGVSGWCCGVKCLHVMPPPAALLLKLTLLRAQIQHKFKQVV